MPFFIYLHHKKNTFLLIRCLDVPHMRTCLFIFLNTPGPEYCELKVA